MKVFVGTSQTEDRTKWGWFIGYPSDRLTREAVEQGYFFGGTGLATAVVPSVIFTGGAVMSLVAIPAGLVIAIGLVMMSLLVVLAASIWFSGRYKRQPLEFQQRYIRATDLRLRLVTIAMPGVSLRALGEDATSKSLVDQYLVATEAAAAEFAVIRGNSTSFVPATADELALLFGLCRTALVLARRLATDSTADRARLSGWPLARRYRKLGSVAAQLVRELEEQRRLLKQ